MLVATDGSAIDNHNVAGWGIAIKEGDQRQKEGGMVKGADQSSYAAELEALRQLIKANKTENRTLRILCDNKSVVDEFRKIQESLDNKVPDEKIPRFHFGSWLEIKENLEAQGNQIIEWIPSHGKQQGRWEGGGQYSEPECRRLNREADEIAGEYSKRQQERYGLEDYRLRLTRAKIEITKMIQIIHHLTLEYGNICEGLIEPGFLKEVTYGDE